MEGSKQLFNKNNFNSLIVKQFTATSYCGDNYSIFLCQLIPWYHIKECTKIVYLGKMFIYHPERRLTAFMSGDSDR